MQGEVDLYSYTYFFCISMSSVKHFWSLQKSFRSGCILTAVCEYIFCALCSSSCQHPLSVPMFGPNNTAVFLREFSIQKLCNEIFLFPLREVFSPKTCYAKYCSDEQQHRTVKSRPQACTASPPSSQLFLRTHFSTKLEWCNNAFSWGWAVSVCQDFYDLTQRATKTKGRHTMRKREQNVTPSK